MRSPFEPEQQSREPSIRILYLEESDELFADLRMGVRDHRFWDFVRARTPQEALEIAKAGPLDVALLSATMPEIDIVEVAEQLAQVHPKLTLLILAPNIEADGAIAFASGRFQYLPKPCNAAALIAAVERMDSLIAWIKNKTSLELVSGIHALPPIPSNYQELLKVINSPDSSLSEIADALAKDIGITSRILQVANSAYFGFAKKVANPLDAVKVLGIARLRSLVLYTHMLNNFPQRPDAAAEFERLWRHSIGVGELARTLTQQETGNTELADEAFTAGLLHDIGKLILMALKPDEYREVVQQATAAHSQVYIAERIKLKTTHAETGAYLLSLWGIPHSILEAIAWHHFPSESKSRGFTVLTAVHVANALEHLREDPVNWRDFAALDDGYLNRLKLPNQIEDWSHDGQVGRKKPEVVEDKTPINQQKESGTSWFTSFFSKNSRK